MSKQTLYEHILDQTHLLVAGATGSGKSVLMNGLIYTIMQSEPYSKKMILIDNKMVEFWRYRNLPHVIQYASDKEDIIKALQNAVKEIENRYRYMRTIGSLKYAGSDIYVLVDEFADLMTTAKKESMPLLCRIAQIGRAARVHLILATQRPTRDIINGQIKVNMDSRIALHVACAMDSRNIIDRPGAEMLPRYGRGLYMCPSFDKPMNVGIQMISDDWIQGSLNYWHA